MRPATTLCLCLAAVVHADEAMKEALRRTQGRGLDVKEEELPRGANPSPGPPILDDYSFSHPFKTFDEEGIRTIPGWMFGGVTEVKEHYIRLTPDRADKRGWLWNRHELPLEEWTATMRFRISGQGKHLFGDGFAFWFTQDPYHKDGPVHGYTDRFTGFGIVFDTFVNAESRQVHKDIALLENDGHESKTAPHGGMNDPQAPGCDANFRYWQGRADFSPAVNRSAVQITFSNNKVTVKVDAKNSGDWMTCINQHPLALPPAWSRKAHLGLTASTGQLADNHDIISFSLSPEHEAVVEHDPAAVKPVQYTTGMPQLDEALRSSVKRETAEMYSELKQFQHNLEHHLDSLYDGLRNTVKKLQEQEAAAEERIAVLERRLREKMAKEMDNKLESSVSNRFRAVEDAVHHRVRSGISEELEPAIRERVAAESGGWIGPFVVLALLVAGGAVYMWYFRRQMTKQHIF